MAPLVEAPHPLTKMRSSTLRDPSSAVFKTPFEIQVPALTQQPTDSFSQQSNILRLPEENICSSFARLGLNRSRRKNTDWCTRAMDQFACAPDKL